MEQDFGVFDFPPLKKKNKRGENIYRRALFCLLAAHKESGKKDFMEKFFRNKNF